MRPEALKRKKAKARGENDVNTPEYLDPSRAGLAFIRLARAPSQGACLAKWEPSGRGRICCAVCWHSIESQSAFQDPPKYLECLLGKGKVSPMMPT